ncbi:substrate-binding domain-containing protein [Alsobacter sp. SYSU M60028]|uniref:Substrate-binding domain-containing protein n=1 Tax=Alsobacter ponti TaxID=2962936 RepID=A0ABT1L740_9HYPH|nr:substrate-binding domain-containing protein [Alsobacter ponti]
MASAFPARWSVEADDDAVLGRDRDLAVADRAARGIATQISPQLTTVRVHGAEIGAAALGLLLDRVEGRLQPGSPARRVQIVETLVERGSTARAPRRK